MKKLLGAALLASMPLAAMAADQPTVESLVKEGYAIAAVFPSNAGPGFVLQKDGSVMICFAAETSASADVATQYCKPVH